MTGVKLLAGGKCSCDSVGGSNIFKIRRKELSQVLINTVLVSFPFSPFIIIVIF